MTLFSCWSPGSCFYWLLFCAAMFAVRKCSVGSKFTELEVVVLKWGVVRKLRIWAMTIKFAFIFCSGSLTRFDISLSFLALQFGPLSVTETVTPKVQANKSNWRDKTREKSMEMVESIFRNFVCQLFLFRFYLQRHIFTLFAPVASDAVCLCRAEKEESIFERV